MTLVCTILWSLTTIGFAILLGMGETITPTAPLIMPGTLTLFFISGYIKERKMK